MGWCSLAYSPSTRATAQPLSRATRSGQGVLVAGRVGGRLLARHRAGPPPASCGSPGPGSRADHGVVAGDGGGRETGAAHGEAVVAQVERRRGVLGRAGDGQPTWVPSGSTAQPIRVASRLTAIRAWIDPGRARASSAENGKLTPAFGVTVPNIARPDMEPVRLAPLRPVRRDLVALHRALQPGLDGLAVADVGRGLAAVGVRPPASPRCRCCGRRTRLALLPARRRTGSSARRNPVTVPNTSGPDTDPVRPVPFRPVRVSWLPFTEPWSMHSTRPAGVQIGRGLAAVDGDRHGGLVAAAPAGVQRVQRGRRRGRRGLSRSAGRVDASAWPCGRLATVLLAARKITARTARRPA